MSRKKRIWYPGVTYHVMSRGNRRTALIKDNSDYMRFLESEKAVWIQNPFHMPDVESFPFHNGDGSGGTLEDHAENPPSVQHGL